MGKELLLLSGGVDSAAVLVQQRRELDLALYVDYGHPAAMQEYRAASRLCAEFVLPLRKVSVLGAPLGDMEKRRGARVVPARNVWLIALAAAFGDSIWIGCAPQDHAEYADCREDFLVAMSETMGLLGKKLLWSRATRKERIETLGELAGVCWSCYEAGNQPCGECPSCKQ